jgi:hypothetical protein
VKGDNNSLRIRTSRHLDETALKKLELGRRCFLQLHGDHAHSQQYNYKKLLAFTNAQGKNIIETIMKKMDFLIHDSLLVPV